MKTAVSLLMILLTQISFILYGQSYKPVITNDSVSWDIATWELFGIHMFKLHCQKHPDSLYANLYSDIFPGEDMGKVREDISTGRLYYSEPFYPGEMLIMDMTLNIGDTFQLTPQQWIVADSVYFHDDRKIIRFDYNSNWNEKIMFIEGVGPSISVIYRLDYFSPFYATCKYHNNELIYVNNNTTHFIGCFPDPTGTVAPEKIYGIEITARPNPAKVWVAFNFTLPVHVNEADLQITDVHGRSITSFVLTAKQGQQVWDIRDIKNGVYLYTLKAGAMSKNGKLIIK